MARTKTNRPISLDSTSPATPHTHTSFAIRRPGIVLPFVYGRTCLRIFWPVVVLVMSLVCHEHRSVSERLALFFCYRSLSVCVSCQNWRRWNTLCRLSPTRVELPFPKTVRTCVIKVVQWYHFVEANRWRGIGRTVSTHFAIAFLMLGIGWQSNIGRSCFRSCANGTKTFFC